MCKPYWLIVFSLSSLSLSLSLSLSPLSFFQYGHEVSSPVYQTGPTGCDKTTFVVSLLRHSYTLVNLPPKKIMWRHGEWQPLYSMKKTSCILYPAWPVNVEASNFRRGGESARQKLSFSRNGSSRQFYKFYSHFILMQQELS